MPSHNRCEVVILEEQLGYFKKRNNQADLKPPFSPINNHLPTPFPPKKKANPRLRGKGHDLRILKTIKWSFKYEELWQYNTTNPFWNEKISSRPLSMIRINCL